MSESERKPAEKERGAKRPIRRPGVASYRVGKAPEVPLPVLLRRTVEAPASLTPADFSRLQRDIGNRALRRLPAAGTASQRHSARPVLQAKLTVGPPDDQYEKEADRVAKAVVDSLSSSDQRTGKQGPQQTAKRQEEEDVLAQMKSAGTIQRQEEEDEVAQPKRLQRQGEALQANVGREGGALDAETAQAIQQARGGGHHLAGGVRESMEAALGADFSGVRVHADSRADALNRSVGARAFTTGWDVFFRAGEYSPGSAAGQELLAHELTHVVQQGAAAADVRRAPVSKLRCDAAEHAVQRQVKLGHKYLTVEQFFERLKSGAAKSNYESWREQGETDESLKDLIRPYVDNKDTDYDYSAVLARLSQDVERARGERAKAAFKAQRVVGASDAIGVDVGTPTVSHQAGLVVKFEPGGASSVDSKLIRFQGQVAINAAGDGGDIANWEVGIIQTVKSLDRTLLEYVRDFGMKGDWELVANKQHTMLPGPTRDGPSVKERDVPAPWYEDAAHGGRRGFKEARLPVEVDLLDRPGISWPSPATSVYARIFGLDTFKTWLVLRHRESGEIIFLHAWNWRLDYTNRGGIQFEGDAPWDSGNDAVTTGSTGKDQFVHQNESMAFPGPGRYSQVKKVATARISLGSGQMKRSVYEQHYKAILEALKGRDLVGAVRAMKLIEAGLGDMDKAKASYWKNAQLKEKEFRPLYDDAQKAIAVLEKLSK